MMHIAVAGIAIIKSFEKLATKAYPDPAGIWTAGYGHTGADVCATTDTCTEAQADVWLQQDVAWAESAVNRMVTRSLTQNQFDAVVAFVYNVGSGNFHGSALLAALNAGKPPGECAPLFLHFVKAGGKTLAGLVNRRNAEIKLFLTA